MLTRTVRVALLVLGLGAIALLVKQTGPRLLLGMVARIGWRFAVIVAIYALCTSAFEQSRYGEAYLPDRSRSLTSFAFDSQARPWRC